MLNYLKYEWLRKWKFFLAGIFLFVVVNIDLINRILQRESPNFLSVILIAILWGLGVALVLDHMGRLYRTLFTDEGFLELTLPFSGYKFLGARLLGVVLECFLIISILVIVVYIDVMYLTSIMPDWLLTTLTWENFVESLQVVVLMVMFYLTFILMVYLSMTLSKSIFAALKYSKLISFICFLLIGKGIGKLVHILPVNTSFYGYGFITPYTHNGNGPHILMPYTNFMVVALIILLLFTGTAYLLDRKISL